VHGKTEEERLKSLLDVLKNYIILKLINRIKVY